MQTIRQREATRKSGARRSAGKEQTSPWKLGKGGRVWKWCSGQRAGEMKRKTQLHNVLAVAFLERSQDIEQIKYHAHSFFVVGVFAWGWEVVGRAERYKEMVV